MSESIQLTKEISGDVKELVIARLETLNPNSKIMLLGHQEPISVKDMLNEVKTNTDFGKKIIEVQYVYIKMMTRGEF